MSDYAQNTFATRPHLRDHECLDLAGMGDMGADTKIYHRPTAVYSSGRAIGNLGLDDVLFVLVVLPIAFNDLAFTIYVNILETYPKHFK